jgi:hypothetical protein
MLYNVCLVKTIDIFLGQLTWKLGVPEWMNEWMNQPSTKGLNHEGWEGVE